jgi:hypothetical protein
MFDFIFAIGQAAAAMLLIYGGVLTVMPLQRKSRSLTPEQQDEYLLFKHLQNDA